MNIRKATTADHPEMERIFAHARREMAANGNPTQWGSDRPPLEATLADFARGTAYIIEENGRICATFAYIVGRDPSYAVIEDGKWLSDAPYGTIHRLASDNTVPGVFAAVLEYLLPLGLDIRIDTHRDNRIMRHLLEKHGFTYCGIIYVDDGTPRLAFQRCASLPCSDASAAPNTQ